MSGLAVLLALCAAIGWSVGMVMAKIGLARMDLIAYAFIRWTFALLFIVPYGLLVAGFRYPGASLIGVAAVASLLDSFLGGWLYLLAMERSPAHQVTALSSTAPFWGVMASVLFLRENPTLIAFLAAFLVVSGAYYLVLRADGSPERRSIWGPLSALLTGVLWGIAETVPTKYCLNHGMTPITLLLVFSVTAVVSWGLLASLQSKKRRLRFTVRGVRIAFFAALMGSFLGWMAWLSSLTLAPASLLSPIRGSTTLFAFLFSVLLLRERPGVRAVVGVFLVFSGVLLVSVSS
jgi:drug/metabolite transporter (DMT)-like permease